MSRQTAPKRGDRARKWVRDMANNAQRMLGGVAIAAMMTAASLLSVAAEDTVVIIEDNGDSVSNSAAGANNVVMERNPGQRQAAVDDRQAERDAKRAERANRGGDGGNGGGGGSAEGDWSGVPEGNTIQGTDAVPTGMPETGAGAVDLWALAAAAAVAAAGAGSAFARRRSAN